MLRQTSRRTFLQASTSLLGLSWARLKSWAGLSDGSGVLPKGDKSDPSARLFPVALPDSQWSTFRAAGYGRPVTGICYRTHNVSYFSSYVDHPKPASGMPLGGIDTGALYLEPSGVLGYSSIFNHLTPLGGPLNTPYLGISVGGKPSVFATGQTKNYAGNNRASLGPNLKMLRVGLIGQTDYWGHYPIADVEYKLDVPVEDGMRAWSPFIPGDVKTSNTPGAVFEVHIRNTSSARQTGCVAFSFPGFADHRTKDEVIGWPDLSARPMMPPSRIERRQAPSGLTGVWVEDKAWGMSYVLAALDGTHVRTGGALGSDGLKWYAIEKGLPSTAERDNGGSSITADFSVDPGQEAVVRFVLAWYAPEWEGNGDPGTGSERIITEAPGGVFVPSTTGKRFSHMYAARYANAGEVAGYLAANHGQLLKRIVAWQSEIYNDPSLPGWLADALI